MSRKILPIDSVKLVESDKGEYWGDAYGQTLIKMYLSNKHEKIYFNKLTMTPVAFVFECMVTVFYIY